MARQEQLDLIKRSVKGWNEWRNKNTKVKINLSVAQLIGTYLSGASLHRAELILANLTGANLQKANLNEANLQKAILIGANLTGAKLTGANLKNAQLTRTYLARAKLKGANLSGANLSGANLSGANLSEANLTGANLGGAILNGTILKETQLKKAKLNQTVFGLTSLEETKGIDRTVISGECIIDFNTLRDSPNLSHSFLHKLGISELALTYVHDLYKENTLKRMYPVFLSHSWGNKAFARKLYEALNDRKVHCWFDEKQLKPGDDIYEGISRGIDVYDKTILICSKESLESWWVDEEMNRIFAKERRYTREKKKKTNLLIPITIDNYIHEWDGPKAEDVRRYVIGDFSNWQDDQQFEEALGHLILALQVHRSDWEPPTYINSL